MKELTFREVIANIKEGEVWEYKNFRIEKGINIDIRFDVKPGMCGISFGNKEKFKLQRKEYTFEEAFKAYEEGKEIESVIDGKRCYKRDWIAIYGSDDEAPISRAAIRGKWYIND
ncbi:MAG: hypothetical protein HUJ77_14080 [Clostridium sp.]|uniref:hypothetical protein n=1 Tax=Clostridium sp. TaxID=1506 RepID=UPI0025BE7280|nr:hypothetical protein [Clostridium sp.]MCF0149508.1 hypothetical protein [Clostridium sp.]